MSSRLLLLNHQASAIVCFRRHPARIGHKGTNMKTELLQRITIEPGKCGGRPCIRGMRIRVQDILDMLAAGTSEEEILRDYPYLERDDIRAAITYAAAYLNHTILPAQTR